MKAYTAAPLFVAIGYALPQACKTTTEQVVVPTSTATYLSTYVTTVTATTPLDLGTYTDIIRVSSTKTLETLTSTECTESLAQPTTTVYTSSAASSRGSSGPSKYGRGILVREDADCTDRKSVV